MTKGADPRAYLRVGLYLKVVSASRALAFEGKYWRSIIVSNLLLLCIETIALGDDVLA